VHRVPHIHLGEARKVPTLSPLYRLQLCPTHESHNHPGHPSPTSRCRTGQILARAMNRFIHYQANFLLIFFGFLLDHACLPFCELHLESRVDDLHHLRTWKLPKNSQYQAFILGSSDSETRPPAFTYVSPMIESAGQALNKFPRLFSNLNVYSNPSRDF
jgi:hypothetical protein